MTDAPKPKWRTSYSTASNVKVEFLAEALQKLGLTVRESWPLARAARRLGLPFEDWNDEYDDTDTRYWLNQYLDDLEAEIVAEKERWVALHGKNDKNDK